MKSSLGFRLVAAAWLVIGLAACVDNPNEHKGTAGDIPAPTTAAPQPERVVRVSLSEYQIDMPSTIEEGPTTFEILNRGLLRHSFAIRGQGVEKSLEESLLGGARGVMKADLPAGQYLVYCPVDAHQERGMSTKLTVEKR